MRIQFSNSNGVVVKTADSDVVPHPGEYVLFTPIGTVGRVKAHVNVVELDYDNMVACVYLGTMMKVIL